MVELALLVGLGAVGYLVAKNDEKPVENFVAGELHGRPTEEYIDHIVHTQESKGHSNEVPFFGANQTQLVGSLRYQRSQFLFQRLLFFHENISCR